MDRRPGIRLPSPQEPCSLHPPCPCRRHTPPSPGTPRRCPAYGSRNLKPMRLGGTLGGAGRVASQGVDRPAGSGPAGAGLHRQSGELCLIWSNSGSSGGRLTGESWGHLAGGGVHLPRGEAPPRPSPLSLSSPDIACREPTAAAKGKFRALTPQPQRPHPTRSSTPHPCGAPPSAGVPDRRGWAAAPQSCPLSLTDPRGRA